MWFSIVKNIEFYLVEFKSDDASWGDKIYNL